LLPSVLAKIIGVGIADRETSEVSGFREQLTIKKSQKVALEANLNIAETFQFLIWLSPKSRFCSKGTNR
jgi:hypothetical protein